MLIRSYDLDYGAWCTAIPRRKDPGISYSGSALTYRFLICRVLSREQRTARYYTFDPLVNIQGRGRQVIAVARTCNLIFIVLDVNKPLTHKRIIEAELEGFGIRLNKEPPNITFKRKEKGGINMTNTVPLTHLTPEEVKAVLSEYRVNSADVAFRCDATVDDLIDVLEGIAVGSFA